MGGEAGWDATLTTDVLIVGGGAAGLRAAIEARAAGADVVLVVKGRVAKSGATPTANAADLTCDGSSAAEVGFPGDDRDSPEQFFRDIMTEGLFLNNERMVEAYVRDGALVLRELVDWGMKVYSFEEAHSQKYVRGVNTSSKEIMKALGARLRQDPPRVLEDHMVVDLLVRDGTVCGAVALDMVYGRITVVRSKAVVLAAGGWQNGWYHNSTPPDLTGDGQAMVYRAGGELADMEMVQWMPVCLRWPPSLRNSYLTYLLKECGVGKLINAQSERFMERYDPRMLEQSTKEIVAIATALEVAEGRGTPHGGVFFSLADTPREDVEEALAALAQFMGGSVQLKLGLPKVVGQLSQGRMYEVGNVAHYMMGGVRVDEYGRASLPGLFAAGECSSGLWGANRVASALSEAVVQGRVAGRAAAQYARGIDLPQWDAEQAQTIASLVMAPLNRADGPRPFEVRRRVWQLADRYLGVVKVGHGLQRAITELEEIERCELPSLCVGGSRSRRANAEWIEALQLRNLVQCLKMTAVSALHRTESRGAHYRADFTDADNDRWVCNIVLKRAGEGVVVREEPVVLTRVAAPKGRLTFDEACRLATSSLERG